MLRLAGAVLFAAGIFVLLIRKGEDWADFPVLVTLAIPAALFYGLGIGAVRPGPDDGATGENGLPAWRATAAVLGIIFVAFALIQLIETIGGDPDKAGWMFIISMITAAAAAYAAFTHGLRYGVLLAGLALIIAWISLVDVFVDPSATAVRWLLVLVAAALAFGAYTLHGNERREASELVTAAGIAGVAAGVTALFAVAGAVIGGAVSSAFGGEADLSGGIQQRDEWDVFLLLVSVALIWYGANAPWRGPAYVGAIGLLAFALSAGTDIASLVQGEEPATGVFGWPLLLLVLGGAALAAGLMGGGGTGGRDPAPAASPTAPTETLPRQDPPPPAAGP